MTHTVVPMKFGPPTILSVFRLPHASQIRSFSVMVMRTRPPGSMATFPPRTSEAAGLIDATSNSIGCAGGFSVTPGRLTAGFLTLSTTTTGVGTWVSLSFSPS